MTTFLKLIRKPFGIILPLDEVKRRVICDALDKCDGNYLLAAHLLGIGKTTVYRKARAYNYQTPKVHGEGLGTVSDDPPFQPKQPGSAIKVTPRDQQVLDLLVQGCSNKEIAGQLSISSRTVKQHLRTLFLRSGIREGRKRVRLATAAFEKAELKS